MRTLLVATVAAMTLTGLAMAGQADGQVDRARKTVAFYRAHANHWIVAARHTKCAAVPWHQKCRAARVKVRAAKQKIEAWEYQNAWWKWLPDKWQRVGACETGYGRRPGNWRWNSGAYQGAFGFARSTWDRFRYLADPKAGPYPSEAYLATPRQQYEVALAVWRRYGFSGWGCRNA